MMRLHAIMCLGVMLVVVPAWAELGTPGEGNNQFRSFNEITQALDPLGVIANHDGIKRSIDLQIQFKLNSSELLPAAQRQVKALANALKSKRLKGYKIQLIGHTDVLGDDKYNQWLSQQRAQAVLQALVGQYHVQEDKLQSIGKGESALLKGLAGDDAKNRRVEVVAIPQTRKSKYKQPTVEGQAQSNSSALGQHKAITW